MAHEFLMAHLMAHLVAVPNGLEEAAGEGGGKSKVFFKQDNSAVGLEEAAGEEGGKSKIFFRQSAAAVLEEAADEEGGISKIARHEKSVDVVNKNLISRILDVGRSVEPGLRHIWCF